MGAITPAAGRQAGPPTSRWFTRLSLRAQITLLIALVVTVVVACRRYLQIRAFEASLLNDLLATARSTAQTVADDIELRPEPLNLEDSATACASSTRRCRRSATSRS